MTMKAPGYARRAPRKLGEEEANMRPTWAYVGEVERPSEFQITRFLPSPETPEKCIRRIKNRQFRIIKWSFPKTFGPGLGRVKKVPS